MASSSVCNMFEAGGDGSSVDGDPENSDHKRGGQFYQSTKTRSDGGGTSGKAKLNIVLCGYNTTLKNSVSKIFRGKPCKPQKEMSKVCEKREEKINGRQITVIELPAFTRLSEEEVMREKLNCLILCDPGVHRFILVTPVGSLTNEDKAEMEKIKKIFNSNEHFMVLFISELTINKSVSDSIASTESQRIVSLYGSWYSVMGLKDDRNSGQISRILDYIEKMKTEPYSLHLYMRAQEKRVRDELEETLGNEIKELQEKIKTPEGVKLNLVLCGSDRLKSFISNLILNQSKRGSALSTEYMRRQVELHGRLVNLLELPALTRLSEEEVMRQTLRCVSLCDPGVHVFFLIIPDAPLNNEDRAEMENIQKIFSSRINKHTMILICQNSEEKTAELNEEKKSVIQRFGGRHHFIGPDTQVSLLVDKLKQMVEENRQEFFSTETFLQAQMKKLLKFEEMKKRINSQDSKERADDLRIVLVGKTGVGKSATGNTILRRVAFKAETSQKSITKVCKKERAEINGRHVTVIDTPGLFDTELTNEEIQREISNCISMILPGPHVLLLLIPVGRFTQEEEKSVKIIQGMFGENSLMYTIVLFTRGDDLDNKTIEQYLENPESPLTNLIKACGNRFHVFNNKKTGDRTQVSDLLQKIDHMVKENGDSYYSCKMFRDLERQIQEKEKKMLLMKHEEEKEKLKTIIAEEKQKSKTIEEKYIERKKRYETEIKEREEQERKMREEVRREREEWERQKQQERQRRDEEDEKRREKEQEMREKYNQRLDQESERRLREREDLQLKYEEEKGKNKTKIEEQRQNRNKEKKRKEEEFRERYKQYKRDIKDIEDHEREIREEMKRERDEWEKQKQQERQCEEEEKETRKSNELKRTPEGPLTNNDEDSPSDPGCLRILLFGSKGNGKSATGNTILGNNKFHNEVSSDSVTTTCKKGDVEVDGKSVTVIDTPGLFDSSQTYKQVVEEIVNCVSLSAPGPHVFIIVLSLGRITEEDRDILDMIKMIFGSKAADFSIVLFTKGDSLKKQTIEQYVEKSKNDELKKLISECGNRFLAFNNTETQDRTQVTRLINMIEEVKKSNEGRYFTTEMFEEAAISIEKRRKILEENKRKNQAQVKQLEAKYVLEVKLMRKRLEEKKLKIDEERVRLENKFRGLEETLRREFEEKEKSDQKKQEMEDQKQSEEEEQRRAEYDQTRDEMERENENQRLQCEKQQKERKEEDRKREEEYKQAQEKLKTEQEHIMAELRRKQEEEIKKRDLEEQMKKGQEEEEREEWKRKIKEAEDEEIQEEIKRQQREWEEEKKRQMREREKEERGIKKKHEEQLSKKQDELEKMGDKLERDREEEKQMIENERAKQKREEKDKEREYEEERNEMKRDYEQLERKRKEEWKWRKQEDEERREEKRKRWGKMMEDLKREQEEEIRRREREEREIIEREEKECNKMKQKYKEEIEKIKKKHQDEARKQREELNDFEERRKKHIEEFKGRLEEELNKVKKLREELKAKWSCIVM